MIGALVEHRHAEPVMGTVASFLLVGGDAGTLARATAAACDVLHRADEVFSTWRPESPLSRIRRHVITVDDAPPEVAEVLELCREMVERSGGWFDPWRMPGGVDPTGLVKGWATRQAARVLAATGAEGGLLNVGGDIATFGAPAGGGPWRAGVRHPLSAEHLTCVAALAGELSAMATSGAYERPDHVLDPFTGVPATRLLSATVVGPDLAVADAVATGLFAAGEDGLDLLAGLPGYEAWIVTPECAVHRTAGFPIVDPLR